MTMSTFTLLPAATSTVVAPPIETEKEIAAVADVPTKSTAAKARPARVVRILFIFLSSSVFPREKGSSSKGRV
jgi:hypothetical protein